MSSRALTVILNSDHSRKFVAVLAERRDPSQNIKESILKEGKNKFRLKGLSTVYLQGGDVLEEEQDLPERTTQVWIAKGESYAGPPRFIPSNEGATAEDIRIISTKSYVDDEAVNQLKKVANLPGVRLAVGMPDLHPGDRFPIDKFPLVQPTFADHGLNNSSGFAVASEGIYPALIGSDIGCGIALYRLSSSASRARANPKKLASLLRGLDDPWTGSVSAWLSQYNIDRVSEFDQSSLGTVGSGNHFAEICTPEKILDSSIAASLNIEEEALYLLVHTGSRGLGASILGRETSHNSNPYIPPDSPHLAKYLNEHDYAVKWAVANRDLVAYRIKECLPGSVSVNDQILETPQNSLNKIIDVTHNSVRRHSLRAKGGSQDLWVHRKGAAPADKGVVPCPGSRGDFSWLLKPTGDGQMNAHGAGRRYGRQALHMGTKINKSSLTTTTLGSEVICLDNNLLIEERPEAYKNVQCVVEDMEERDICKGVVILRPIVKYKVREGGESRK